MRTEKDPPKKNSPRNHFKARLEYEHDDGATVIQPFFVFLKRNKKRTGPQKARPSHIRVDFSRPRRSAHVSERRIQGCKDPVIDFLISVITLCAHSTGEDKNTRAHAHTRTQTLCQAALKSTLFVPDRAAAVPPLAATTPRTRGREKKSRWNYA